MSKVLITTEIKPSLEKMKTAYDAASKKTVEYLGRDWLRSQMRRLLELVKEEAPKDKGTFADSHFFRTYNEGNNAFIGKIYAPEPLKSWIVNGTGLYGPSHHVIVPVHAKMLHFFIDGQEFFRPWVRGQRPNKYEGRAYRRFQPGIRKEMAKVSQTFSREFSSRYK